MPPSLRPWSVGAAPDPDHGAGTAPSDDELMLELRRGQAAALDELMRRYWPPLLTFSAGLLDSRDEAEDVAQQAFLQLWGRRKTWRAGGSVKAYLFKVARNLSLNAQRRTHTRERLSPQVRPQDSGSPPTPVQDLAALELGEAVRQALASMPPRRREVFELVRFSGLSYRDVADMLAISDQTVANQMSAALAHLRTALSAFL